MLNLFKRYIHTGLFKILYFLGLTFILPYMFAVDAPFEIKYLEPNIILIAAASLILVGVIGVYSSNKSWRKTFFSLSLVTFIPGILSLLMLMFGKDFILALFEKSIINLEQLEPLIESYLARLSRFGILAAFYIAFGVIMFLAGRKAKQ